MKKIISLFIILILSSLYLAFDSSSLVFSRNNYILDSERIIGFGFPTFGWVEKDHRERIIGIKGINIGVGYTSKKFFKELEYNQLTYFWHWGTISLVVPYVGIGANYFTESGFFIGFGTLYIIPYFEFGFNF